MNVSENARHLVGAINRSAGAEATPYHELADEMMEHGHPGANIVVQAGRHAVERGGRSYGQYTPAHAAADTAAGNHYQLVNHQLGDHAPTVPHGYNPAENPAGHGIQRALFRHAYESHTFGPVAIHRRVAGGEPAGPSREWFHSRVLRSFGHPEPEKTLPPVIASVHVPGAEGKPGRIFHAFANPENVEHLAGDLDPLAAAHLRRTVAEHYGSEHPVKLARVKIDPRTGNEPGVNMWTGEPVSGSGRTVYKPDPITQVPQQFGVTHYPTDGIVHTSKHEGTGNVKRDTADSAWYERSAVHKALEDAAGAPVAERDAVMHTAFIKKLLSMPEGRKVLGPAAERYERAATMLPKMIPAGDGSLRSSVVGSRPVGPRMDALTDLVRPMVAVANKLLVRAGLAGDMNRPDYTNPPAKVASDEHADPTVAAVKTVAERRAKDADAFRIGVADGRSAKRIIKQEGAATAAGGAPDESPIPLALGPEDRGHRWQMIHQMAASGQDRKTILAALQKTHELTPRQAADTYRRWARSEDARRALAAEPKPGDPMFRLARKPKPPGAPTGGDPLATGPRPDELKGTAFKDTNRALKASLPAAPESWNPTVDVPVHPQVKDTALAYHLRQLVNEYEPRGKRGDERALQIQTLARHVLAGKSLPGVNGDPHAALGAALKKDKHRYADLYNWHTMSQSLMSDHLVKNAVEKMMVRPDGMADHEFWDKVRRQFMGDSSTNPRYEEFWRRLRAAVGHHAPFRHGPESFINTVKDSILRIGDRELDREYLKHVRKEQKVRGSDLWDTTANLHWRSVMGRTPTGPHRLARKGNES